MSRHPRCIFTYISQHSSHHSLCFTYCSYHPGERRGAKLCIPRPKVFVCARACVCVCVCVCRRARARVCVCACARVRARRRISLGTARAGDAVCARAQTHKFGHLSGVGRPAETVGKPVGRPAKTAGKPVGKPGAIPGKPMPFWGKPARGRPEEGDNPS